MNQHSDTKTFDTQPSTIERPKADEATRDSRTRPLRRWSVAELIAAAVFRTPAGGVAH